MKYEAARFVTSAPALRDCPPDSEREVAFAGRSNAGKSSAINALTRQSRLARTSKTPGRTQLINFFELEPGRYLVDLPGYGFAKVPLKVRDEWQRDLGQYLRKRDALAGLVLVVDIRHAFKEYDQLMIDWAAQGNLPVHILLTKADKLKRGAAQNILLGARRELASYPLVSLQLFSVLKNIGIDELRSRLDQWLEDPASGDETSGSMPEDSAHDGQQPPPAAP